jgi:hypothetical protein
MAVGVMDEATSDFIEVAQAPRAWLTRRRRGDRSADAIARKVRAACAAGGVSALVVLAAAVWRAALIGPTAGGAFAVMCALVMLGLVYGTARYSRACATSLLWLYVCALASLAIGSLSAWSVAIGVVGMACVFVLVQGVQATYTRHEIEHEWSAWQVSLEHTLDPGVMAD